jgi:hypothetical protein
MLGLLWRMSKGYRLRPWRSPYLRWRIETYWGLHAERIRPAEFCCFVWQHRAGLLQFLKWADRMEAASRRTPGLQTARDL